MCNEVSGLGALITPGIETARILAPFGAIPGRHRSQAFVESLGLDPAQALLDFLIAHEHR
jgi:hypothetical protein